MQKSYDVAVVFGGVSSENEVSVITGTMVCNVLKKGGKSVLAVYVDHGGALYCGEQLASVQIYKGGGYKSYSTCAIANGGITLYKKSGKPTRHVKVDCIINCCHGGVYEGGAVVGAAHMALLPTASAQMFESSAFINKYYTKLILKSLGVNVAEYAFARNQKEAEEGAESIGYPVIVKPVNLGSSIGIAKADNKVRLIAAVKAALELDSGVLIERYLSPIREINCAAYYAGGKVIASPLEEVSGGGDYLSYDDKYSGGGTRKFPASLSAQIKEQIAGTTKKVYASLGMRGIVRFDYILTGGNKPEVYVSEINTVPGSLSQYLVSDGYANFYAVLISLIEQAKADFAAAQSKRIITTGILNNITANTCKLK